MCLRMLVCWRMSGFHVDSLVMNWYFLLLHGTEYFCGIDKCLSIQYFGMWVVDSCPSSMPSHL
jgi:hypothetical protein